MARQKGRVKMGKKSGPITVLISFIVLAALLIARISRLFPEIDPAAWAITVGGFAVLIAIVIKAEPLISRLPIPFIGASENRRQYAIIIVIFLICALLLALLWDLLGPAIAPHFGQAVR